MQKKGTIILQSNHILALKTLGHKNQNLGINGLQKKIQIFYFFKILAMKLLIKIKSFRMGSKKLKLIQLQINFIKSNIFFI